VRFDEAGSRSFSITSVQGDDATNIKDGKALFGLLNLNNRETMAIDGTQKHRKTCLGLGS
jgi:hypothetical protein